MAAPYLLENRHAQIPNPQSQEGLPPPSSITSPHIPTSRRRLRAPPHPVQDLQQPRGQISRASRNDRGLVTAREGLHLPDAALELSFAPRWDAGSSSARPLEDRASRVPDVPPPRPADELPASPRM